MRRKPPDETLDSLLLSAGMPLGDVARSAELNERTLWGLRTGRIAEPRISTVAKLAKALGVDPARVRAAIQASYEAAAH